MNMIQRNPNDPKHSEHHDGEYEFWPLEDSTASHSTRFPAAVANGLGLLAAAAAVTLLTLALSVLYARSAPYAIYDDCAYINVSIYNNVDNLDLKYTLSLDADRDTIICEGSLEGQKQSVLLTDLSPGTEYFLQYYSFKDGSWERIGVFSFTTSGDFTEPTAAIATEASSEPTPASDPTDAEPEPTETVETEPTEETTEETTEPSIPPVIWYPPAPVPPEPPVDPPTEPVTEPATEPETEPATEPETEPATEPVETTVAFSNVVFSPPEVSGDLNAGYYSFDETHTFENVPDGEYEVKILQNGTEILSPAQSPDADGTLTITFSGNKIAAGKPVSSVVEITSVNGDVTAKSEQTTVLPVMTAVKLTVEDNHDGTHTYTVTVTDESGSDCTLALYVQLTVTGVDIDPLDMVKTADGTYTGSTIINDNDAEDAAVSVRAVWEKVGSPSNLAVAAQTDTDSISYTPTD